MLRSHLMAWLCGAGHSDFRKPARCLGRSHEPDFRGPHFPSQLQRLPWLVNKLPIIIEQEGEIAGFDRLQHFLLS